MADDLTAPAPGAVLKTREIGGKHYPESILADRAGEDVIGAVTTTPAANTLLGRVKALVDKLPTLGAKAGSGSVSIVPATDSGMATDAALGAGLALAVTPGTAALTTPTRAIYVGGAGNLAVTSGGQTVTFVNVPAGAILPVKATHILATNTTASSIVALI